MMGIEQYIAVAVITGVYTYAKVRLTAMKIQYGLYKKGSTNGHEKALARARESMDPYRGLNEAKARMKGSLNAHKDALERAKRPLR